MEIARLSRHINFVVDTRLSCLLVIASSPDFI